MSEHDANKALTDTARLRILPDPLEQTQRMPIVDRRRRQAEAVTIRHCCYTIPVPPADRVEYRDFRDGRCIHGGGIYSCEICAVQLGRAARADL